MLVSVSQAHLCLREVCGEQRLCSSWWDTKPFASHLHEAYWGIGGFSNSKEVCEYIRKVCNDSAKSNTRTATNKSIQALAMKRLLAQDGTYSFYQLLHRRCSPLGLSVSGIISPSDVERAFTCASANSHVPAMAWLKTVTNAWTTSYRMHEPIKLKCLFGCDAPDRIDHYLSCRTLWSILHEAFGGDFPPCMFARINYAIAPSNKMLIVISAAFEIYHALKIGLRSIVEQCLVSGRFAPVVGVARKLARTSAIANGFRNFDN
jgi:hypothetical protein